MRRAYWGVAAFVVVLGACRQDIEEDSATDSDVADALDRREASAARPDAARPDAALPDATDGGVAHALVGYWSVVDARVALEDGTQVNAFGANRCATPVQGYVLGTFFVDGNLRFAGGVAVDYEEVWTGYLRPAGDVGTRWEVIIEECPVQCAGTDTPGGVIGEVWLEDDRLVFERQAPVIVDRDLVDCDVWAFLPMDESTIDRRDAGTVRLYYVRRAVRPAHWANPELQ